MAYQILHSISQEPPLLRWLHSHDPDRDITPHLLEASTTYIISTPQSDHPSHSPPAPHPPTACMFVPMYRRNQFILGRLYGPTSPNATALTMLAHSTSAPPPTTISRRFVVDLSFPTINFLEYEWFSDGKLSVTMHCVDSNSIYTAETILLDSPETYNLHHFARHDLLLNKNRPSPTKVVMRMRVSEHSPCQICYSQGQRCSCPHRMRDNLPKSTYPSPTNWESWVAALRYARSGFSTSTVDFTIRTPFGKVTSSETVFSNQLCEIGIGDSAPHAKHLVPMFLQSADMLVNHPATDTPLAVVEGKKASDALVHEISDDEEQYPAPNPDPYPKGEIDIDTLHPATPFPDDPLQQSPMLSQDVPRESLPHTGLPQDHAFGTALSDEVIDVTLPTEPPNIEAAAENSDDNLTPLSPPKKEEQQKTSSAPVNPGREQGPPGVSGQRIVKKTATVKRRNKGRGKLLVCPDPGCGKTFNHKGHYNEHRKCVHEKRKDHKCAFVNCQGRFFKRSDRDRHMRSKHDFTALVCPKCDITVPDKTQLDIHMRDVHKSQGKHVCQKCKTAFPAIGALKDHIKICNFS